MMTDYSRWISIVSPHCILWDKKWGDRLLPFWDKMQQHFPKDHARLIELEHDAHDAYKAGASMMIVRVKLNAYFDLLDKVSKKASEHEAWRQAGSSGVQDGNVAST